MTQNYWLRSLLLVLTLALGTTIHAQQRAVAHRVRAIKTSPAYCLLVLEKVKAEANLYDFQARYFPSASGAEGKKQAVASLKREMQRLRAQPLSNVSLLTEAYGKLLLRKVELETRLADLGKLYTSDWPETKKTRYELAALKRELRQLQR